MNIEEKRKERRKKTAEVFTPEWLAQEMLDKIPDDYWDDPKKTALEPSCGDGVFVLLILKKRLEHGINLLDAVHTLYACDIMEDNIDICRERVRQFCIEHDGDMEVLEKIIDHNIFCCDTLNYDFEGLEPYEI